MLVYPENASRIVTIVGIDPGTVSLGLSAMRYDAATLKLVSVEGLTFNSEKMLAEDPVLSETHSERMSKIRAQYLNLVNMFRYYRPSFIVAESPFYNSLRPAAYGALMEVLAAIKSAAADYDNMVPFITYPPSTIKIALGAGAWAKKEEIRTRMLNMTSLPFIGPYPLDTLDEHAIDAIAVCNCHYKTILKGGY